MHRNTLSMPTTLWQMDQTSSGLGVLCAKTVLLCIVASVIYLQIYPKQRCGLLPLDGVNLSRREMFILRSQLISCAIVAKDSCPRSIFHSIFSASAPLPFWDEHRLLMPSTDSMSKLGNELKPKPKQCLVVWHPSSLPQPPPTTPPFHPP
jgi:hypothetical protein